MSLIENVDYYIDSKTGWKVLTEEYLLKRGKCCLSKCRHCPYKKEKENNESKKDQS